MAAAVVLLGSASPTQPLLLSCLTASCPHRAVKHARGCVVAASCCSRLAALLSGSQADQLALLCVRPAPIGQRKQWRAVIGRGQDGKQETAGWRHE